MLNPNYFQGKQYYIFTNNQKVYYLKFHFYKFKFNLGDTLLRVITENCNIFSEEPKKISINNTIIQLKVNDKFTNDITLNGISILQLPMLIKPRTIKTKMKRSKNK